MLPAFIGGSGVHELSGCGNAVTLDVATPFAEQTTQVFHYRDSAHPCLFLPRHGSGPRLAPHQINYRANLWALKQAGATCVIAFNAVGGISDELQPGTLCLPDQLIDYTWGRANTFHEPGQPCSVAEMHPDFTHPFSPELRPDVLAAAQEAGLELIDGGVYGCTQGPRLETAAEVRRLQRDGCTMIGMTAMPEAILARELALPYCSVALVVNRAAGLDSGVLDLAALEEELQKGVRKLERLVPYLLPRLKRFSTSSAAA